MLFIETVQLSIGDYKVIIVTPQRAQHWNMFENSC